MTATTASPAQQAAWEQAQRLWGVRMHPPALTPGEGSRAFSWFSFPPAITVDPVMLDAEGGTEHLVSVLAHELGHHVLAPSTRIGAFTIAYQMGRAIAVSDTRGVLDVRTDAALLANLWEDLLINEHIVRAQRRTARDGEQPDLIELWRVLTRAVRGRGRAGAEADPAWWVYLRACERLWQLPPGTLCDPAEPHAFRDDARQAATAAQHHAGASAQPSPAAAVDWAHYDLSQNLHPAADAVLLARTVQRFGSDPVVGAGPAGMILAPYLAVRRTAEPRPAAAVGTGCVVDTGAPPTAGELARVLADARLREPLVQPLDVAGVAPAGPAGVTPAEQESASQAGQSFGIAETLALFAAADPDAVLAAWYRVRARPYVEPLRRLRNVSATADLPGPLELWEPGDSLSDIDWPATLVGSTTVVPGVTTVRRSRLLDESAPCRAPITLDIYIDSSGSMRDPRQGSPAVLAGMILALSVLRGGGAVRTTSFASAGQVAGGDRFSRNTVDIVRGLTTFFAGGTVFPLDLLADRYLRPGNAPRRSERRHLVVLTDAGYTSLFGQGQDDYADVTRDVRPHLASATVVIDGSASEAERAGAAGLGYELVTVSSLDDTPAACARLAVAITSPEAA